MKKSMIRELFNNIRKNDDSAPSSEMLDEYIKKFWAYEDLLNNELLNDEQKMVLDLFAKQQWNIESEREVLAYEEGFKTGLLIGIECAGE